MNFVKNKTMEKRYWIFTDPINGEFSFKKFMNFCTCLIFIYGCVTHSFGMPNLPTEAWVIIGGVFAFYFGKNAKIPFTIKPKEEK